MPPGIHERPSVTRTNANAVAQPSVQDSPLPYEPEGQDWETELIDVDEFNIRKAPRLSPQDVEERNPSLVNQYGCISDLSCTLQLPLVLLSAYCRSRH